MIPKTAIERAIEGGWQTAWNETPTFTQSVDGFVSLYFGNSKLPDLSWRDIALDPTFWQALGKALGWPEQEFYCKSGAGCSYPNGDGSHERNCVWEDEENHWRDTAHRFYDLILTDSETEKYWNDLLS